MQEVYISRGLRLILCNSNLLVITSGRSNFHDLSASLLPFHVQVLFMLVCINDSLPSGIKSPESEGGREKGYGRRNTFEVKQVRKEGTLCPGFLKIHLRAYHGEVGKHAVRQCDETRYKLYML